MNESQQLYSFSNQPTTEELSRKAQHKLLPKDERPEQSKQYVVYHNGEAAYIGTLTKYLGGCWATVRVDKTVSEKTAHYYTIGMEFDIKVALYEFEEIANKV